MKERDYRFDVARVVCMTYIVAFVHLYAYIHTEAISACVIPIYAVLTDASLGLFTFCSGYLLSTKYRFDGNYLVGVFFKKRIIRIMPLFLLSAIMLYLIGFNGLRATINGMLCISPFLKPRPYTLWYIPVIIICYAITPLVCRKGLSWRICCSSAILTLFILLRLLVPSVDKRLSFNLLFFLIGAVSAPYFDWKFKRIWYIKVIFVLVYLIPLLYLHNNTPEVLTTHKEYFAGLGVFAILFVCEWLSDAIFCKDNTHKDNKIAQIIRCISYSSMACYMFHRLFFWAGEMLINPAVSKVKWLYMAGIVFPVMLYLSYYIQRYYDITIERIKIFINK